MAQKRIGGIIFLKVGSTQLDAKGEFTYNLGRAKKTQVIGSDGVHGWKVEPQVPMIEGKITDNKSLNMALVRDLEDVTVTLQLANGKTIQLNEAVEASDGNVTTAEGEAVIKFEGTSAEEITA
jgi:hypothetical protein